MKISFFGATRAVTGSCHLVEAAGKKFLIDCGLFQGTLAEQLLNYDEFPFMPSDIDFIILTHAHIDHSGRIPKLYTQGFKGPVYATKATCDLAGIMLPDSGHIQEKEIEWVNRKRERAGKKPTLPLYTAEDAMQSLEIFNQVEYREEISPCKDIKFVLKDAGHMLGSAFIELYITEDGKEEKIVFSGDLGNKDMPILKDLESLDSADYLITESTYGNRLHGNVKDQSIEFLSIVLDTIDNGGNVIIPSFAVGRTQEILYEINKNLDEYGDKIKRLRKIPVYVDSPLAVNATQIFRQNPDCFDEETLGYINSGESPLDFPNLHFVKTADESKALNEDPTPKVIISASGMCEVGRIKHHLKHNLWRPECSVMFVGYQAEGTLGRKLCNGEKLVKIYGEEISVNAQIKILDGFSGHADHDGLMDWISNIKDKPKNIFIVHGEYEGQKDFANDIFRKFNIKSFIPQFSESFNILNGEVIETEKTAATEYKSTRLDVLEMLSVLKEDVDTLTNKVKVTIKHNADASELESLKAKLDSIKAMIKDVQGK
ncbi:MAG: MBL fold metallo-hydrolase [Clostridia bacterium]